MVRGATGDGPNPDALVHSRMPEEVRAELAAEADAAALEGLAVFPDNWDACQVFQDMQTQWRMLFAGMSGRRVYTGLEYASLPVVLELREILAADRRDIFRSVRMLEAYWLDEMRLMQSEQAEDA